MDDVMTEVSTYGVLLKKSPLDIVKISPSPPDWCMWMALVAHSVPCQVTLLTTALAVAVLPLQKVQSYIVYILQLKNIYTIHGTIN